MKLVVFDLDGTLTRTNEVDSDCFVRAFMETSRVDELNTTWEDYPDVSDEGCTRQIFIERFGRDPAPEETGRIVDRFLELLSICHRADASAFEEVRGATRILQRLRQDPSWAIALATGAWRRSAEFKIDRAALPVTDLPAAFSEDGPSREAIVRKAIERAQHQHQREFERIISVGDALWDVKTARNLGLPFLGIAGGARAALLRDNGASHVIEDYRDPDRCLQYLSEAQAP